HVFQLDRTPGLYYITGVNKLEPDLGANGVGKSTIWDALTWVLWGRTGKDNRPADAIRPWFGKGRTEVGLTFKRGTDIYCLWRGRNPNSLQFGWDAGGLHQDLKEIQQEEIPKLLGMTEEMFRRTLVLHQSGTFFLDLKPEQQAQMFTEALSLDVWLRAIDVAKDDATANQRKADQAGQKLATNDELLADIANQIADQTDRSSVFETDKAARIRKGEQGIVNLEADLATAEKDAPKKPSLPDDAALQETSTALSAAKQAVSDDKYDLRDIVKAREADQAKLMDLSKTKPKCETCGQALTSKQAETMVADLQKSIRDYVKPENKAKQTLADSEADLVKAQAAYDKARATYDDAKDGYNGRLSKYEAAIRKIASIQGELTRWRDNLVKVNAETNQAAAEIERLKKRRSDLRAAAGDLEQDKTDALAMVEEAKFWQDGFREIRLSIIDRALLELQMAASRHAMLLGLQDWGIKFDTERETKSGSVNYSFTVLLYPPGKDEPVKWESYSGGEAQRWQLAVAFALSEVLLTRAGLTPNIQVLDEPTKGLSPAGVADLLDHLRDRAIEQAQAIYFVDHHSLDKGAFDGTLMVTKTKKGSSFAWQ
ncbi:MAG TPA: AAA family ATPase, partial [Rhizorhapis sp.]|nr:AAA family ATPase [Rhizorhapis sp.]